MGWTDIAVYADHPRLPAEGAALRAALAKAGVAKSWVFGGHAATTNDFAAANARALALAQFDPEAFVPIGVVNPFEARVQAPDLVRRGMKGFRVLTNWGNWISLNNVRELVVPLAGVMRDANLPLIVALEGFAPMTGGSVALPTILRRECPGVCLILDHCWSAHAWEDYLGFAEEYPDVWLTLAGLPQLLLRRVIDRLGTRRILAGSWYPETDPDLVYIQIERAAGVGDRLQTILAENAARAAAGHAAAE